jgi:hypothetical protein
MGDIHVNPSFRERHLTCMRLCFVLFSSVKIWALGLSLEVIGKAKK